MSRLIVSSIETQNIKFDSDTTAFTIGSDGGIKGEGTNTTNLQQGLAKAWANFDESNSTIRDNFNVTDLTDNGTGYFTVNLTNAMGSDDYVRIGNAGENADTGGNRVLGLRLPATNSFNINTRNSTNGNLSDTQDTCVAVLGDLA